MNATENDSTQAPAEIIELGVASIETLGQPGVTEITGDLPTPGISEN